MNGALWGDVSCICLTCRGAISVSLHITYPLFVWLPFWRAILCNNVTYIVNGNVFLLSERRLEVRRKKINFFWWWWWWVADWKIHIFKASRKINWKIKTFLILSVCKYLSIFRNFCEYLSASHLFFWREFYLGERSCKYVWCIWPNALLYWLGEYCVHLSRLALPEDILCHEWKGNTLVLN